MHTFLSFIKEFRIPKKRELRDAVASFSKKQFALLITSTLVAFCAMLIILGQINSLFVVTVPTSGGSVTEGIIGMPTLVNPVLALSDADKDLTAIVYSGLMRKGPDGALIPDLADSYTISADGTVYTFLIKKTATFHDGTPVTADDVIFTIEKIKDPMIKSPRKASWDGISVSKQDELIVVFTLKQPYISFMDNMTIGILPMHIWKNISATEFSLSSLNIKAVGSGPYQIQSVSKNSDGIPEKYALKRFTRFTLGIPHIKYLNIISFSNERELVDALQNHSIDQAGGISPQNTENIKSAGYHFSMAVLPRMFGMFYNSAHNKIFTDPAVLRAFDKALDRQAIVDQVLYGYGTAIHSPIPETIMKDTDASTYVNASLDEARVILDKAGWVMGSDGIREKGGMTTKTVTKKVGKKMVTETVQVKSGTPATKLAFSLITGNTPELKQTVAMIKEQLEALGASVDTKKVYETGQLNQLIRARDYEALFFGQIINHESDLFSFWHSSQKNDPGLNIALYSSKNVDTILSQVIKTLDSESRASKYKDFIAEFNKDIPAFLLYSPKYIYATSENINHIALDAVITPSDRFASLYSWYADTDHVWKLFAK